MNKYFLILCFFFGRLIAFSQENIPLENWRMHISFNSLNYLAHGDNKIFAAANNGIFYIDKEDNSINSITKMDNLSDVGVSAIAYSDKYNALLIGYENGNIDIWKEGIITNINTVLNAILPLSKRINQFNVLDQYCYVSTNFGVLILNLENSIIEESMQNLGNDGTPLSVFGSTLFNDSIFLATEIGVISTTMSPNVNILDYNNWRRYGANDIASENEIASIISFDNKVYAAEKNGDVYCYNSNDWSVLPFSQNIEHTNLSASNGKMIISSPTILLQFDGIDATEIDFTTPFTSNYSLLDGDGNLWIADNKNGLLTNRIGSETVITPEGPFSDDIAKLYYHNNKIFALSGGVGNGGLPLKNNNGFYVFENGFWKNYNSYTHPSVLENLVDITFNPVDNNYYIASYGSGLLKFDGNTTFELIDETNSPIEAWTLNNQYTLITSLSATSNGLWVGNYGANNSLHFLNTSNSWSSFSQGAIGTNAPVEITIAENGDKWIRIDPFQNGNISVFNEETGKLRALSKATGKGDLPQSDVYDIAIDKDDQIWVGTGRGVAYYTSSYSIENQNNVDAITPIVSGFPLLRDERITAIAIDGGNRKWFGTDNGLWLFDANVQIQIYYFNTENSPLISDHITDIAIHETTGEVFIATKKGMVSFRSPASEGMATHQNVKIFPNPVLANFDGIIGISGLAQNNNVKITDISGKLIRQLKANGGTAGWNIKDYNGRRASTGMYLVFSASESGEETFIGKIAVVE